MKPFSTISWLTLGVMLVIAGTSGAITSAQLSRGRCSVPYWDTNGAPLDPERIGLTRYDRTIEYWKAVEVNRQQFARGRDPLFPEIPSLLYTSALPLPLGSQVGWSFAILAMGWLIVSTILFARRRRIAVFAARLGIRASKASRNVLAGASSVTAAVVAEARVVETQRADPSDKKCDPSGGDSRP